jgi:opacity protein-like surface antigen
MLALQAVLPVRDVPVREGGYPDGRTAMRSVRSLLIGSFLCVITLPSAFAAAPLASAEDDRRAKQALPRSGQALVYVYRLPDSGPESSAVWLNGRALGELGARTYLLSAVPPGQVELRAGSPQAPALLLRAQEGRVYFVRLAVNSAGVGQLRQVSYGTGRQELHPARLVRGSGARETAPPPAARSGFNLIVKGGSFALGDEAQSIFAAPVTVAVAFDGSSPALGLEGEWLLRSGWAFGGELFTHAHDYTSTSPAGAGGDMTVFKVMVNAKKYFRPGARVQPYVGAGVGIATVDMSGDIIGTVSGFAVQAMTGVAFRWEHAGVYTELKFQQADADEVAVGGLGLFVGASYQF